MPVLIAMCSEKCLSVDDFIQISPIWEVLWALLCRRVTRREVRCLAQDHTAKNAGVKTGIWDFWFQNTLFYVLCSLYFDVRPKVIYFSRPSSNAPSLTRSSSIPWEGFSNLSAAVSCMDLLRWTEFRCVLFLGKYISGSFTKLWVLPQHNCIIW